MALRDQPYLPLYVQDFLTDEKLIECSASATGVYIRVMCIMHKSDPYGMILLKQKDKQTSSTIQNFALKLIKSLPYDLDVIKSGLEELINEDVLQIEDDKLIQKRMVKDFSISNKRAEAGKKGGEKTQSAKAKDEAKHQANSENENENENINIDFSVFWDLYDKKLGAKEKCKKKWNKLSNEIRQKIIDTLPAFKMSIKDKQFQPYPESYLNQERWNDEIKITEEVKFTF